MADKLFPELPKDLTKLSDDELAALLAEHEVAAAKIEGNDPEYLEGFGAEEVLAQFKEGALAIMAIREEKANRVQAAENYTNGISEIADSIRTEEPEAEVKAEAEGDDAGDGDGEGDGDESGDGDGAEGEEAAATEPEAEAEAEVEEEKVEEREAVLVADASEVKEEKEEAPKAERPVRLRRPVPTPSAERIVVNEPDALSFVASGYVDAPPGTKLSSRAELAEAQLRAMKSIGRPSKRRDGREERYLVASLDYSGNFPEERRLDGDFVSNGEKIAAIGSPYMGQKGLEALVASGGFCAPLQPIYTMPQLATNARPVRDALPSFRAERGGINVPTPTTMGDAAGAITVITAEEDSLGGTFATKACLDLDCPDYTETAVTVISHCREFGNLNAMAWPEKIAHENELTMAEHARIAEGYLLGRIKTLSVEVTSGAETASALAYLVEAIAKSAYGMRSRLRLPSSARFTALLPRVALDILITDNIFTVDGNRFRSAADLTSYLESIYVDVTWYIDTPMQVGDASASAGVSQIADSEQTAAALDAFPDQIQWAMFPAGTFLHLDMAELNLGIVRDSTLNATNDFQIFGEVFENVARIGPAQAAYWETTDICANGMLAPAGTARTCD